MSKNYPIEGNVYHVFNKSIAGYKIFNDITEFSRILNTIRYYQIENPRTKFSKFTKTNSDDSRRIKELLPESDQGRLVKIVAYCIMPTHVHLILNQLQDDGISIFTSNVFNSYTRYFNIKYNRKGPLWEGRSKRVLVESDEQLIHLTRYVHLNPVTAYLVNIPEQWHTSSYNEYLSNIEKEEDKICEFDELLDIDPISYKEFVDDQISYQRELKSIKDLCLE
ncbi:MAG: transposase [Candidatus Omnitrophica bacterium]|nr:transposase [Candidatus Omnitrophota bacterium]